MGGGGGNASEIVAHDRRAGAGWVWPGRRRPGRIIPSTTATWEVYGNLSARAFNSSRTGLLHGQELPRPRFRPGQDVPGYFSLGVKDPAHPLAYLYLPASSQNQYYQTTLANGWSYREWLNPTSEGDLALTILTTSTSNVTTYRLDLTVDLAADHNMAKVTGTLNDYVNWYEYGFDGLLKRIDSDPAGYQPVQH